MSTAPPLHVTPGTGYLTAATYGRGMWRVDLEGGGNPTYNVGGTVTLNGNGLQGVSVAAKQGGTTVKTGTTGANGTYSILDLAPGAYTIVPTKASTTFTPASANVTVVDHHVGNINFTASTSTTTYNISGAVTRNGAGVVDVAVQAVRGGTLHHTFTLADGSYTIRNVVPGTYTVTPSMEGATFTPVSRSVPVTDQNVGGVNFTANSTTTTAKINGRVTRNGAGFAGVTVSAGGVDDTTDANGNYSLEGLEAGTYTVTPTKTGVLFNPESRQVNLGATDANNVNFATTVPLAPENLTGTALSGTQVRLNWSNVSQDETGYKVDRSVNGGGFTEITGLNLGSGANTVTLNSLTPGTDYTFRVRSYNQAGDCADPPTVEVSTPATAPTAPSNLVAKAKKKKKIALSWSDNSNNETGFAVQIRQRPAKDFVEIGVVSANSTGAIVTGLKAKKTYDFRVYAVGKSADSAFSNIASAKARK